MFRNLSKVAKEIDSVSDAREDGGRRSEEGAQSGLGGVGEDGWWDAQMPTPELEIMAMLVAGGA